MSIQAPQGILNIPNAILRVGKLSVDEVVGADTILNTVARNTILLVDDEAYHENKNWSLKLPNAWAGEFECNTASAGNYSEFNFYNEGASSNAQGYNLTFNDTAVQLRYDGTLLKTGTLASTITGTGVKKVRLMFERTILSVTVDGTLIFTHDDTIGPRPRVYSTTAGGFLNFFTNGGALKNLKIVNEKWMSDGTSNIAYVGGGEVAVGQALAFNRVSNVSQIKVDSNVVTEYTGPHDRPLRKYPEVAMTSASQDGYVVTQSGGTAYLALDEDTSTRWYSGSDSHYDSAGGAAITDPNNANVAPRLDTNTDYGDWLAIEVPTGIKLESFKLMRFDGGFPSSGTLYAKNSSGDSWTEIYRYDGYTGPSTGDQQDWTHVFHVNSTIVYKNFALVGRVREAGQQGSPGLSLKDWELYGYEEGSGSLDTTLKSVYNVPATTGTQLEVYYDAKDYTQTSDFTGTGGVIDKAGGDQNGTAGTGVSFDTTYKAFVFDGTTDGVISDELPSTVTGAYVHSMSLWFKHSGTGNTLYTLAHIGDVNNAQSVMSDLLVYDTGKLRFGFYDNDSDTPDGIVTLNQWYHVVATYSGGTGNAHSRKIYVNGKEIPLTLSGAYNANSLSLPSDPMLYLGSQQGSFRLTGSIANFRLYSKVLNADQVRELYDYQKDYFLGSKSQVTLYKGHLGVGVTEPSGQLELAGDERIQEYPPRALTGYETLVEGHGVFYASASSEYVSSYAPWKAFRKVWDSDDESWASSDNTVTKETGLPSSTAANFKGILGNWIQLKLPYKIDLHSFKFESRDNVNFAPDELPSAGIVYGSNDEVTWDIVHSFSGVDYGGVSGTLRPVFTVKSNTSYNTFRLLVTKNYLTRSSGSYDIRWAGMGAWRLFGTPGPTTLDKGSLSLGRSLDVPRVSRYDVDTETPRPEKLVLDFDTTVNSTPTDISGKGNHGAFYNMASKYLANEKAFTFDGTNDHISTNEIVPSMAGAQPHTMSVWFKPSALGGLQFITCLGEKDGGGAERQFSAIRLDGSTLQFWTYSNDLGKNGVITAGVWHHAVAVYVGGATSQSTMLMYLNGEKITNWDQDTTDGEVLGFVSPSFALGEDIGRSSFYFPGQISNPKLYNVALEPSEVKKLYNLGRTGRSMVISDTAVGIGKVPEAQLDVRGSISATGTIRSKRPMWSAGHKPGYNYTLPTIETIMIWSPVNYDYTGNYDSSTGYYTIPITGYYAIGIRALIHVPGAQARVDGWIKKISGGTTTRVIMGERLAGSEGGRATNNNMTCQVHGTVYLQSGDRVYAGFSATTASQGYVVNLDGDFNEFYGRLIEEVIL
jgi:hypothetical protein